MREKIKCAALCLLLYIETFLFLDISGLRINTAVTVIVTALFAFLFWRRRQTIARAFRKPDAWSWSFSILLAGFLLLGSKLQVNKDTLYDEYWETYALPLQPADLLRLLLLLPFLYTLSVLLMEGLDRLSPTLVEHAESPAGSRNARKLFWSVTGLLFLCMFPYLLAHWPGLIYGDSMCSIYQFEGEMGYYDQFPVAYTLFIGVFLSAGKVLFHSITAGCALYSLFQMAVISAGCAYIVVWLFMKNVNRKLLYFVVLFYALSPMFPLFGISMWKDPLFSMALAIYCLKLFDIVTGMDGGRQGWRTVLPLLGLLAVIGFFRSNGLYVILFSVLILLICKLHFKKKLHLTKQFWLAHALVIAAVVMVTGPVYTAAGVEKHSEESLSIPLQQLAAAVVYDGDMSEAEREVVDTILPLEDYRNVYQPGIVDVIKWNEDFNVEYVRGNRGKILKTWIGVGTKNPGIYLRAWSLNTFGYWAVNKWDLNQYVGNITRAGFPEDMDLMGIKFGDLLEGLPYVPEAMFSVATPTPAIALCAWMMFFAAAWAASRKRPADGILFIPCLASILTLILAAPDCYWPRYAFSVYYLLPVILLFPGVLAKAGNGWREQGVES